MLQIYRSEEEPNSIYGEFKNPWELKGDEIRIVGIEVRDFPALRKKYQEDYEVDLKFCFTQDDTVSTDPNSYKLIFFNSGRQHATVDSDSDINGGFMLVFGTITNGYVNYLSSMDFDPISNEVLAKASEIATKLFEESR